MQVHKGNLNWKWKRQKARQGDLYWVKMSTFRDGWITRAQTRKKKKPLHPPSQQRNQRKQQNITPVSPFVPKGRLCQPDLFWWVVFMQRIGSEVKSSSLQKGTDWLCQLSKIGLVPFPPHSLNYQKASLSLWYSERFTWPNLCYQMKGFQKLIHLKGLLAREVERPMVQYLGFWFFLETSVCIGLLCFIILSVFLQEYITRHNLWKTSPTFFPQHKTSF